MENILIEYRTPSATPEEHILKDNIPKGTDRVLHSKKGKLREIGDRGVWSVSSQKSGFGLRNMRDNLLDTYWQSDGQLPHLITVLFRKKTVVSDISIFLDHEKDESYTPSLLLVRCGSSFSDVRIVDAVQLHEPKGWVVIEVRKSEGDRMLKAFLFQVVIIKNHQNGRDSHIRQIKVH